MRAHDLDTAITRRGALLGGGAAVGGLVTAGPLAAGAAARTPAVRKQSGKLPSKEIEKILELEGSVSDGVLSIDVSRDDIGKVRGPLGVEFDGSFEIDGTLTFQPLGRDLAFFNGDLPLKPRETQPFIDAIIANRLVWQAFHQHYIEMSPNVWFIHWRGVGAPLTLATAVRNVLRVTATKLPQKMPSNPKSPLDAKRLATILRGSAQIGDEGVVTVNVLRSDRIVIDGVRVSPEANISTNIEFKPLGGSTAWAAPDFAMTGTEVMKVVPLMRRLGWFSGCLYNQETSEAPQLYFDHMLKRGDAYSLAAEIRRGLDLTRAQ
jgi:Domain of Unknown Function (DUF1259)